MQKVRALLIAEAANPEWVSVPLVGWSHCQALSQVCDAHVVTQIRNRDAITRFGWTEGKEFTAIDSEAAARLAYRVSGALRGGKGKGWTMVTAMNSLSYGYFERLVWQRFGADLKAGRFDVVHRITPLSPTAPSSIASKLAKIGVPFVVGPLNGGVRWPLAFDSARRAEKEWLSYVRGAYRLLPGYGATRRHAAAILCGSRDTMKDMPKEASERLLYMAENAVDPGRFPARDAEMFEAGAPLRVAFVGRLVPYKGADMLLEAAATLCRAGKVQIDVIGDGPERSRLEAMVLELGISAAVEFASWVPHAELHGRLGRSSVFGFPSIREFGGGAVLEAMAMGLVPVVVDYGGPGEIVTPETGFTVPMGNRAAIVASVRGVLEQLAGDPALVRKLAVSARQHVERHFTWAVKARRTLEVYDWVLGRGAKPDFPAPASR